MAMALRVHQLQSIATHLDSLKGQRVGKLIQYAKDVFSFRFARGGRLMMVLDNQNPLLFLMDEEVKGTSLSTPASALLRKKLSNAEFLGAKVLNEDRVIALSFLALNDIFVEEPLTLVLELIPTKANLALLDEEGKVLLAFRSNSITDPRPLFHGVTYEPPIKKESYPIEEESFDVLAYFSECEKRLQSLQERRKSALYQSFFREIKARIKALKRKMEQIEADIEKGTKHLHDADYGNYLFTYPECVTPGADHFDYYGESIPLDPRKSASESANDFFKKAKKAKNAISLGEENLRKANLELQEAEQLLAFAQSCDEETLSRLLGKDKAPSKGKKQTQEPKKALAPFVAKIADRYYYFGRSAKQNDSLSFLYATHPSYLWFHVKDTRGAHVILPFDKPSNQEITYACELCLLATGLEQGEVQYTEHRNIRKGSVRGQVILGSYQSAYIRKVSPEAKEAYEKALAQGGAK